MRNSISCDEPLGVALGGAGDIALKMTMLKTYFEQRLNEIDHRINSGSRSFLILLIYP